MRPVHVFGCPVTDRPSGKDSALDCRVYARAAAWIVGADRWSEARWVDLETQVAGDGKTDGGGEIAAAGSIRAVRSPARRRSVASNYMR